MTEAVPVPPENYNQYHDIYISGMASPVTARSLPSHYGQKYGLRQGSHKPLAKISDTAYVEGRGDMFLISNLKMDAACIHR